MAVQCIQCMDTGAIICPTCGGSGWTGSDTPEKKDCWLCSGKPGNRFCELCHGNGFVYRPTKSPCWNCHGSKGVLCPRCQGRHVR